MPPDTHGDADITRPSQARVYDYLLGGTDNYAVDRQTAEHVLRQHPGAREPAVANRRFLVRAVEELCGLGMRQFLDLGAGLPTAENTHQVAQRAGDGAHVVYVDNDATVLAHANALLGEQDRTGYVHADLRNVDQVLDSPTIGRLLDLDRPVALLLVAVVHYLADEDDPAGLIRRYVERLAPGSYVTITSASVTGIDPDVLPLINETTRQNRFPLHARTREEIAAMLDGLELVEPGLVSVTDWPEPSGAAPLQVPMLGAIARVP
ncbi:SAM-dependent methyltransferase [Actinomadura geliboluensis]|uniref:SAM-dependent methyltransferase n=1 Tax=Actinomadura geliboluensis TaxID=882440 RepID=UPI0036C2C297